LLLRFQRRLQLGEPRAGKRLRNGALVFFMPLSQQPLSERQAPGNLGHQEVGTGCAWESLRLNLDGLPESSLG